MPYLSSTASHAQATAQASLWQPHPHRPGQPYGCPRRVKAADHGRGPIQLSWNLTYDVAGNALTIFSINGSPDV